MHERRNALADRREFFALDDLRFEPLAFRQVDFDA
jgi:hypothetical protein